MTGQETQELDRLRRQNAALRVALEDCERVLRFSPRPLRDAHDCWDVAIAKSQHALSNFSGSDHPTDCSICEGGNPWHDGPHYPHLSKREHLPSVAGRMEMTHEAFQNACQVALGDLQENPNCDTHLVYLLCEAVRCSRECCELAKIGIGMLTREQGRLLAEALYKADAAIWGAYCGRGIDLASVRNTSKQIKTALAHARTLGFDT